MEIVEKQPLKRIGLLDEIRGFAVILMIIYHGLYLLSEVFEIPLGSVLFNFFMPVQPLISGIFIVVAGISSRLSHSNAKRGAKLLAAALVVTLVTAVILPLAGLDGLGITFGILHFLSLCMLIFALAKPALDKIPPLWGMALCMVLYLFTAGIGDGFLGIAPFFKLTLPASLYELPYLFPLGICKSNYTSADFFPLFPRVFLFLAGTWFGIFVRSEKLPAWAYKNHVKPFAWVGKKALIIYLAHAPILFAVVFITRWLIAKF